MGKFSEICGRLRWGVFPVRREVKVVHDTKEYSENLPYDEDKLTQTDVEGPIEYRNEAGRKWYKFFDEYEYRMNKYDRAKHKWWKWFDDDDTTEVRKALTKLDILLVLYSFCAYFVKYLSQTNLNNAYIIDDFTKDLGMGGNDLVDTQVLFNVGNIVFQIPFLYVLYSMPLNYVLPALDIAWSILTFGISAVRSVQGLKTLRFFIGAMEAPSYMAYHFLFASWYKPSEINRRAGIYYMGQYLGIMISSLISSACVTTLNGKLGHPGWSWIFIIDGIISLAIGIIGIYMIPNTPNDCYSIFLSDREILLFRERMKENHTSGHPKPKEAFKTLFSVRLWRELLCSWEFYVVSIWNLLCWNNNNGTSGAYNLWVKSLNHYSQGKLQQMTALTPGLGIVWIAITSWIADAFESRWFAIVFSQAFNITGNVILAVWNVPERAKWFAWCLQYFGWAMAPSLYSWEGDLMRRDTQKRGILLVWMNMLAQASTAWMAVIVWRTVEQPRYLKGYSWTAACAFGVSVWTFLVLALYKRNERRNALQNGIVLYNRVNTDSENDSETETSEIKQEIDKAEGRKKSLSID